MVFIAILIISFFFMFAFLLSPSLALRIRRMNDAGYEGDKLKWLMIPIIGNIYFMFIIWPPSVGPNEYGEPANEDIKSIVK